MGRGKPFFIGLVSSLSLQHLRFILLLPWSASNVDYNLTEDKAAKETRLKFSL